MSEALEKGKLAIRYSMLLGGSRIMPIDPRDLEHVFVGPMASNYVKGREYDAISAVTGKWSLIVLKDDAVHATQRRGINPAFGPSILRAVADSVVAENVSRMADGVARLMGQAAEEKGEEKKSVAKGLRLDPLFDETALNIIAQAAFRQLNVAGTDVANEFRAMTTNLAGAGVLGFLPGFSKLPLARQRAARAARRNLDIAARQIIGDATAANAIITHSAGGDAQQDGASVSDKVLVDFLVTSPEFQGDAAIIRDHIFTFLFAGHETSSKALVWATYLLAMNPHAQQQLADELAQAFTEGQVPTLDAVQNLPYLNGVVKESLRLFPPAPIVFRAAVADDVLPISKAVVRKGEPLLVNIYAMHHNPHVWGTDVEEFKPERWERGGQAERVLEEFGPCAWMPFLVGARNCIGKDFAMNELLIAIATLVLRFELLWPGGVAFPDVTVNVTLRPTSAVDLILKPRPN
jgi:cytochrome P450